MEGVNVIKQPKKPTWKQKQIISKNNLQVDKWSVLSETDSYLKVINKYDKKIKILRK